nr:hypothetical protein [Elizabethkingia sp. ASV34]
MSRNTLVSLGWNQLVTFAGLRWSILQDSTLQPNFIISPNWDMSKVVT